MSTSCGRPRTASPSTKPRVNLSRRWPEEATEMLSRTSGIGMAVAVLAATLGIAACGSSGIENSGGGGSKASTVKVQGKPSGDLTISNWPLYIDKKTVPDFEKATGVSVKYIEDINDNNEFFAKLQPLLADGESGGRSLIVPTDWMAKKMYDLGYL